MVILLSAISNQEKKLTFWTRWEFIVNIFVGHLRNSCQKTTDGMDKSDSIFWLEHILILTELSRYCIGYRKG